MIETIRALSPIDQVVAEYLDFRRVGQQLRSKCPFHEERTPSFYVNAAKGLFFCHGCQVGGDVFEFITLLHHCDFYRAVAYLGKRSGISSQEFRVPRELKKHLQVLKARRAAEDEFKKFMKTRTAEISARYRALGRSATWAENALRTMNLTTGEEEMAWTAIENYRVFELRVEREGLLDIETLRREWQNRRDRTFGEIQP